MADTPVHGEEWRRSTEDQRPPAPPASAPPSGPPKKNTDAASRTTTPRKTAPAKNRSQAAAPRKRGRRPAPAAEKAPRTDMADELEQVYATPPQPVDNQLDITPPCRQKRAPRPKRSNRPPRTAGQSLAACRRVLRRLALLLGNLFYEVGYYAEYSVVRFGRACKRAALALVRWLGRGLYWLARALLWLPAAIFMMFGRLFWHLFNGVRNVYMIWYTRDPDKPGETWKKTFSYLGGGISRHAHLVPDLLGWALPVLAGAVFVFTVRTVLNYQYVLQVSYNGQVLGYVANEEVVETAQQDVQNRIIYVNDTDNEQWELRPSYALAVSEDMQVLDADEVADAILANSGEEIVEATGFYLNGTFYGAVTDRERLVRELEEIKAPYATGEEGEFVSFVVEPELVDGVYLRPSVVDNDVISDLIHGQTAGEVRYTVANGDTPSGIASAYGLTTAELASMNPDKDIMNSLYPGDSLVVSQAVSFLQVQVTYRRTEQETVPYSTVRTNTDELAFGFTRVKTAGVDGLNECVYDYVYIDGVLQSKTLVSTTVISEPVTEEILVGTLVRAGVTIVPSTGGYNWPIPGYSYVSRGFTGVYAHNGMDICGGWGTPIYAAQSGVVTRAVYTNRGYGVYLIIDHGGGYSTLYGHCSSLAVSAGDIVNQGDLIAYMGSTGNSTGNHCHFEVIVNGTRVNPAPYVGYG